jgi:hypothetical protein
VVADEKVPVTVVDVTSVCPPWVQLDRAKVVVAVSDPVVEFAVMGGLKLMVPETPTQAAVPVAVTAVAAVADAFWVPAMTLKTGTDARHAISRARFRGARSVGLVAAPSFPRFLQAIDTSDRMIRGNISPPFISSRP